MTVSLSALSSTAPWCGATLTVVGGADAGLSATHTSGRITIGTAQDCDLRLSDPTVSRYHAAIELDPRGAEVHDLGSTNGTIIGGHRVDAAYLVPGTLLKLGHTRIRFDAMALPRELDSGDRFGLLLGRSPAMQDLFAHLRTISVSDATVLIEGETGTGKELIAETIHRASQRVIGPFVVFDCARVAPSLLEAELFGHERGAYTGAVDTRVGAIESADGGTVFLDEIGELSLNLQPKLLRVLESCDIARIGSNRRKRIDVRIVAATNRRLADSVDAGEFRADLFYRLNVVTVRVPALRERVEDIGLLANHFYQTMSTDPVAELPAELVSSLESYDWPGNVRELRSAVTRWMLLGARPRASTVPLCDEGPSRFDLSCSYRDAKARMVSEWERTYLMRLMQRHHGNVSRAARSVRMSRNYLSELLQRHRFANE